MIVIVSSLLAGAIIVGQALLFWGFLKVVKSFGAFTEVYQSMNKTLLANHETYLLLHKENQRILEALQRIHKIPKAGAA